MKFRLARMALTVFAVLLASGANDHAAAAKMTAADKAWIDTCISDRKQSRLTPVALRKYCVCMHEVVEDNRPFESITELERTYPPAHRVCLGGKPE